MNLAQEKLSLAQELGLTSQQALLQAQAELDSLVGMSMPVVTNEGIAEILIQNLRRHPSARLRVFGVGALQGLVWGLMVGMLIVLLTNEALSHTLTPRNLAGLDRLIVSLSMLLFGLCGYGHGCLGLEIHHRSLDQWEHELPYGALCAVKEATERGFSNFTVWYPSLRQTDPVLTAQTPGSNQVLVFAWDEGLLYDEQRLDQDEHP